MTPAISTTIKSHVLGYPRIGVDRRMKTAVEAYWKGDLTLDQLEDAGRQIRKLNWQTQVDAGLNFLTVGDFCWYDHILDHSIMFGVIPERFQSDLGKTHILNTMFCMARGKAPQTREAHACSMMKWFNTNYHYIVPELVQNQTFKLDAHKLLNSIREAHEEKFSANLSIKPVIVGPLTYLYMSKVKQSEFNKYEVLLPKLLPVYEQLLKQLEAQQGVEWVQIDEPILGLDLSSEILTLFTGVYDQLKKSCGKLKILLTTYFTGFDEQSSANLDTLSHLNVDGVHLDLSASPNQWKNVLPKLRPNQILSLGLINGRNIWKANVLKCLSTIDEIKSKHASTALWVGTSCSLLHCPVDLNAETSLDPEIKNWLSFAKQKCHEVALLAKATNQGVATIEQELNENKRAVELRQTSPRIHNQAVKQRCQNLPANYAQRHSPYPKRAVEQKQALQLPLFPTTTIGSFPQTKEIRSIRHDLKSGKITTEDYIKQIRKQIADVVKKEEDLDLDVLVHGEAERNDMVEYFGELLDGYTFSQNGWVQSYGSRCVKPPIIFGDVSRPKPMTVEWIKYAQTLTKRVMKGMLTGPVTMLSWSFVRDDQPTSLTSLQLALALRDEIVDLETNGIQIVQLDEPAFREALPLRRKDWPEYLKWSVHSFKVATGGVKDKTQIHTHMCYSEFNDVIESIAALDADVITIESSRSDMELLKAFEHFSYPNEIGPGVYDIHSPIIPTVDEIVRLLEMALKYIPAHRMWVNPDCGLKTRGWPETTTSLSNMVKAAKILRQKHSGGGK